MLKQLVLQFVLILLNAFFAATEIAVISLNEKKVRAKAESGNKKSAKMLEMIEEPTRFLSTIQIGITLAGFLGSAFAADNFAERLSEFFVSAFHISSVYVGTVNTISVIVITLVLSFFTLVLGELVPKRVAMKYKEQLAEYVCGIISSLAVILKPIIWFLTVSTNTVLKLFGITVDDEEEPVSKEDIVIMLDAAANEGTFDEEGVAYIKNVFKFDKLAAVDIMTQRKNVVYISEEASEEEIIDTIKAEGFSRIPVYSGNSRHIIGILHARDYLLKYQNPDFKLSQVMFDPVYVPETMKIDLLFRNMQEKRNHISIVVNEFGFMSGIVTMEDVLEELVGEIWDENDESVNNIVKISDGTYTVSCATSAEEFFDYFGIRPDEESEAATVNGWIIEIIGTIPKRGDTFVYDNMSITVTRSDDMMTNEIKVELPQNSIL